MAPEVAAVERKVILFAVLRKIFILLFLSSYFSRIFLIQDLLNYVFPHADCHNSTLTAYISVQKSIKYFSFSNKFT